MKGPLSPIEDKTVIATDKSIKVTVNHGNMPIKGPVMSVKGRILLSNLIIFPSLSNIDSIFIRLTLCFLFFNL